MMAMVMIMITKYQTIIVSYFLEDLGKAGPELDDGLLQRLLLFIHLDNKVFLNCLFVITLRETNSYTDLWLEIIITHIVKEVRYVLPMAWRQAGVILNLSLIHI